MIQRIQSIYLLICSLGFGSHFLTNFAKSSVSIPHLMADKVYEVQDSPILMGLTILGSIIALGAIFVYNNRPLQQKLSIFTIIASILIPLVAFLLMYNELTPGASYANIQDDFGLYLCVVPAIFGALAYKSIGKDEKLVRSMDRLR